MTHLGEKEYVSEFLQGTTLIGQVVGQLQLCRTGMCSVRNAEIWFLYHLLTREHSSLRKNNSSCSVGQFLSLMVRLQGKIVIFLTAANSLVLGWMAVY